jgi:hypothetical protein
VNSALADYLDPSLNCYKIGCYSLSYDRDRILQGLEKPLQLGIGENILLEHRRERLLPRLEIILRDINLFFDHQQEYRADIAGLSPWRVRQLWLERSLRKVQKKLGWG